MDENEINDIRKKKMFIGVTFSKFKKSAAKKELLKALFNGKIEPACYWGAEFICAGNFLDMWNILLYFMSYNIHLSNPKLPLYMKMRFEAFKTIMVNGYTGQELRMRNNKKIRILFAEIITVLAQSRKSNSFDAIKIDQEYFDITQLTQTLKADSAQYAQLIFRPKDPQELYIAINELAYHLLKTTGSINSCFWIEWILEFDKMCIRKKSKCVAERRGAIPVESKFQMEVIWMVWELLLIIGEKKSPQIKDILLALLDLFCIRYTSASKNKRKYILYFAISLLTENINLDIPLYSNNSIIEKVKSKINIIYKQVKKNEEAPNTSYLFNNVSEKNLEKTIKKLETMDKLSNIITRK